MLKPKKEPVEKVKKNRGWSPVQKKKLIGPEHSERNRKVILVLNADLYRRLSILKGYEGSTVEDLIEDILEKEIYGSSLWLPLTTKRS